jgi:hypothetical protein
MLYTITDLAISALVANYFLSSINWLTRRCEIALLSNCKAWQEREMYVNVKHSS